MKYLLFYFSIFLLVGCEAETTPAPALVPPTPTDVIEATLPPPIRYAFAANTEGFVADIQQIQATGQIEQLPDSGNADGLGEQYDIVIAYGEWDGWERSPVDLHIALFVNTALPPFDNSAIVNVAQHSIDLSNIITQLSIPGASPESVETIPVDRLRTELANLGYPDGFDITLAYAYTPGIQEIVEQLTEANLRSDVMLMPNDDIRAALTAGRLHLALVYWTTPEQLEDWVALVGQSSFVDLVSLPISYQTVSNLTITFTSQGFPLATR